MLVVATLAGSCTMTVELAAVRLLAPWFGTSSAVWTNVIAVILLALAIGYLLGARWSNGEAIERRLGTCLLAAAAATAWLPALTRPVAGFFLPSGLSLDEAAELLSWGSLATALVLFLPSTLLLGCVPPLVTEAVSRRDRAGAGNAGGRVLAASTLGSIAGTFATTYVTLPRLGLSYTFLAGGCVLALLGLFVFASRRSRGSSWGGVALVVFLVALATSRFRAPDAPPGHRLLAAGESAYQSVRVVETFEQGSPVRFLRVNEGFDSFQSVWIPESGPLPSGFYYNLFALPAWWSRGDDDEWRLLVIGLGAGTAWRVLEGALPEGLGLDAVGVEIDPLVVSLGRRWMDLANDGERRRVLTGWDGRTAMHGLSGGFDQIVVDAYANQMEIPPHLSTYEFFSEARDKLAPAGWISINVGAFGLGDPVVSALGATVSAAFSRRSIALRVPFSRNCVLLARRDADPLDPGVDASRSTRSEIAAIQESIALPGAARWFEPGEAGVLFDDRNPIESLQRRSIAEGRARAAGTL